MLVTSVAHRSTSDESPDIALSNLVTRGQAWLGRYGFQLTARTSEGVTFERRYRSGWTIFFTVVTFPLGLILLAMEKKRDVLVFNVTSVRDGSEISVAGQAPVEVAQAIERVGAGWSESDDDGDEPAADARLAH